MNEIVNVEGVTRSFPLNHDRTRNLVSALNHASFRVQAGEFLAISGPSGSGKTTLLNLIGCIDQPTSGRVLIDGVDTSKLSAAALTKLRRKKIGFVFQTFNLIPVFTAAENVEFPLLIQGVASRERRVRVTQALTEVGLGARANHRPALVLADEPTANLDTHNATQLIDLMHGLNRRLGLTFLFSTHDARLLEHTERIIHLCDGTIQSDSHSDTLSATSFAATNSQGGSHGQVLAASLS